MARETTYSGIFGDWGRLGAALVANIADLVHIEGAVHRFTDLSSRAQQVVRQQGALVAEKQAASQDLREIVVEGQRLATVLRQAVKQHYGIRSEKLAEFGIQPFRGKTGNTHPVTDPPEPPPTE